MGRNRPTLAEHAHFEFAPPKRPNRPLQRLADEVECPPVRICVAGSWLNCVPVKGLIAAAPRRGNAESAPVGNLPQTFARPFTVTTKSSPPREPPGTEVGRKPKLRRTRPEVNRSQLKIGREPEVPKPSREPPSHRQSRQATRAPYRGGRLERTPQSVGTSPHLPISKAYASIADISRRADLVGVPQKRSSRLLADIPSTHAAVSASLISPHGELVSVRAVGQVCRGTS